MLSKSLLIVDDLLYDYVNLALLCAPTNQLCFAQYIVWCRINFDESQMQLCNVRILAILHDYIFMFKFRFTLNSIQSIKAAKLAALFCGGYPRIVSNKKESWSLVDYKG